MNENRKPEADSYLTSYRQPLPKSFVGEVFFLPETMPGGSYLAFIVHNELKALFAVGCGDTGAIEEVFVYGTFHSQWIGLDILHVVGLTAILYYHSIDCMAT